MKRENTIGWLNLTCVDNSLTLGNYAQRTPYDISRPNAPFSKIYFISHVTNFTYQDPQVSFPSDECHDPQIYAQLFTLHTKELCPDTQPHANT